MNHKIIKARLNKDNISLNLMDNHNQIVLRIKKIFK